MIAKIVFDVLNTDNKDFEFHGKMSDEEYANKLYEFVHSTNKQNMFEETKDVELETTDNECDALILDIHNKNIEETFFIEHVNDGKMFIIKVNIDPNSLDMDCESEIRFWVDDSCKVLRDNSLPDDVKLKRLLPRDLRIKVKNSNTFENTDEKSIKYNTYYLNDCRIIQNNSNEKYKYFFTLIIKKINF